MTINKIITFIGMAILLSACQQPSGLFKLLSPDKTGVTFNNVIEETDSLNILDYEYLYNGGGVALADFNNDGQLDIFFTGNAVANQLYLNRGNFRFEDVTEASGAGAKGSWCSGVAVVDINTDGWPDLYIATNTLEPAARRKNVLLINQGPADGRDVPVFREAAEAYGLADTSHCMNAVFFDYDNDEDLDVFMIVNEMEDSRDPSTYRNKKQGVDASRVDRLYRNEGSDSLGHPYFVNVSAEAGINIPGYSLGVNVVDLDQDGWKDIYVSNDFISNDVFYHNNGDGTFTDIANQLFKHTSHSAMGNDITDINNDGRVDLIALDMLPEDNYRKKTMMGPINYTTYINNRRFGYDYQYVRNTLQLNQGDRPDGQLTVFSDVAFLAGISATDWSWAPLVADFDHNTYRDIIITNGFPKDITDRDFMDYYADANKLGSKEFFLQTIPEVKLKNYAYSNQGRLHFENVSQRWGIDRTSFSNGAAYGDLDGDGDLDYVVNNINDAAFIFQNRLLENGTIDNQHYLRVKLKGSTKNPEALGARIHLKYKGQQQVYEYTPYRGYLSTLENVAHFGLGETSKVDELSIIWPDGSRTQLTDISADQLLVVEQSSSAPVSGDPSTEVTPIFQESGTAIGLEFQHEELDYVDYNVQPLLPHKLSQYGPGLAVGDLNSDGLQDLYITGSAMKSGALYVQTPNGTFVPQDWPQSEEEQRHEELGALFFDADLDGDEDLYLVSGGYEFRLPDSFYFDRFYLNDGGTLRLSKNLIPQIAVSGSCVRAADYDQDGDLDLFIGGRVHPHEYPKPVSSYLLENKLEQGNLRFEAVNTEKAPDLEQIGMVTDALWTDVDQDGWVDLFLAGEWMPLTLFKNEQGKLVNRTSGSGLETAPGWWNSLIPGDIDLDGDIDYIAGNFGKNLLYPVSETYPIRIYGNDFDGNGGFDAVMSAYFKDRQGQPAEFPLHGRGDLAKQIVAIKGKFTYHRELAQATISEIFSEEQRENAIILEATELRTCLIENLGNGQFQLHPLPDAAQLAPVYGGLIQDIDSDGQPDILLVGNDFSMELITGRCDALNGLLLNGRGNLQFEPVSIQESGFYVPGDAKALVQMTTATRKPLYIASQNQGSILSFQADTAGKAIQLDPLDQYVYYTSGNQQYKLEGYYGSGFLSQSGRFIRLPEKASNIEIVNSKGQKRSVIQ